MNSGPVKKRPVNSSRHTTVYSRKKRAGSGFGGALLLITVLLLLATAALYIWPRFAPKDTTPPLAEAVNRQIEIGSRLEADDFVANIQDESEVTVEFLTEPDFSRLGRQEIQIKLTDESMNSSTVIAALSILPKTQIFTIEAGSALPDLEFFLAALPAGSEPVSDLNAIPVASPGRYQLEFMINELKYLAELNITDTTPPLIQGMQKMTVEVESTVSYRREIELSDNSDQPVELEIDSSQVNIREPGVYPVTYIATDSSGNSSEETIEVTVVEKSPSGLDPAELDRLADDILSQILSPGMTPVEKAEAIYWWTKGHISYVNYSDKTSWIDGAYQGINKGTGDCFNYFATAKILLERADIDNLDIVKSTGSHYWSMINLGDGWYHFDTTPRKAGGEFFMLTDAQLMEYSVNHNNSHVWDTSKYPATPTQ